MPNTLLGKTEFCTQAFRGGVNVADEPIGTCYKGARQ